MKLAALVLSFVLLCAVIPTHAETTDETTQVSVERTVSVDPSGTSTVFEIARTFGLGVAVLCLWIWILLQERKQDRLDIQSLRVQLAGIVDKHNSEKDTLHTKHTDELKTFLRENMATMTALTNVVEAVAPAITTAGERTKRDFDGAVTNLREHITAQCNSLREALK